MEVCREDIESMVAGRTEYKFKEIKVLRVGNELPENEQIGATCGIYALDAALKIRGKDVAPRRSHFSDDDKIANRRSIRGVAKDKGLTKIGEIGGVRDLMDLAAAMGVVTTIEKFDSEEKLWEVVKHAVNSGRAIVMPYSCADNSGAPAWSANADGFAHWCLVFGYLDRESARRESSKRILMTTYGSYHSISPFRLFSANQSVQNWPRQNWVKIAIWFKDSDPHCKWQLWKNDWRPEKRLKESIEETARSTGEGLSLGLGDKNSVLHVVRDPSKPDFNLEFGPMLHKLILKNAILREVRYTKTMRGECVVV